MHLKLHFICGHFFVVGIEIMESICHFYVIVLYKKGSNMNTFENVICLFGLGRITIKEYTSADAGASHKALQGYIDKCPLNF